MYSTNKQWALYLQTDYPLDPLLNHSSKTWQRGPISQETAVGYSPPSDECFLVGLGVGVIL